MTSTKQFLDEVRARQYSTVAFDDEGDDNGEVLLQAFDDLAKLIKVVEIYETALEWIGSNMPIDSMRKWQASSLLDIIVLDAEAADRALAEALKIVGEG